jgi:AcrR family transcriptional regulator
VLDTCQATAHATHVGDDGTRERILSAAWQIARQRGSVDFTLAEVAVLAGLSRQALYLHFANRAGLLVEMTRRIDQQSGFVSRIAATRRMPAVQGFRRVLRLWFEHLNEILVVARALEAAAITGDEGSSAYHDRMQAWRETLRISVTALAEAHVLRREWSVDDATDWVWMRTQPANYEYLVRQRSWPAKTMADRTIRSVLAELTSSTDRATVKSGRA